MHTDRFSSLNAKFLSPSRDQSELRSRLAAFVTATSTLKKAHALGLPTRACRDTRSPASSTPADPAWRAGRWGSASESAGTEATAAIATRAGAEILSPAAKRGRSQASPLTGVIRSTC